MRVLIFGGTTEGRNLSEKLSDEGIDITLSVATDYARGDLAGRLNEEEMTALLKQGAYDYVVDATHPYAVEATKNIRAACQAAGLKNYRLKRPESEKVTGITYAPDVNAAVEMLKKSNEKALLTIGSKELEPFTHIENYTERFYIRILPMPDSLKKALDLGFLASNIICMQGPFDKDMNIATMKMTGAKTLVTKDSGDVGGFEAKVSAATSLGCQLIVIRRPTEEGYSFEEIFSIICGYDR